MSSTHSSSYAASKCIDGSTTNFCHTVDNKFNPWLSVQLEAVSVIDVVDIYNRADSRYYSRLSPFEVWLGSAYGDMAVQCGEQMSVAASVRVKARILPFATAASRQPFAQAFP